MVQLTTHSKLLSVIDLKDLRVEHAVQLESLLAFNTQQQFVDVVSSFLHGQRTDNKSSILIIQCDCANYYAELISCARYTIVNEYLKYDKITNKTIMLILQVPKVSGGCIAGFQTAKWHCYHLDDLQDSISIEHIYEYRHKSLGDLFAD